MRAFTNLQLNDKVAHLKFYASIADRSLGKADNEICLPTTRSTTYFPVTSGNRFECLI